jgi:phosphatidylglycerophosphate synthase
MTRRPLPSYVKPYDPWCAVFFVDPLVVPMVPLLARWRVSPNTITWLSLLTGLASGLTFALGRWYLAAGLFWLTFLLDATDGKLARYSKVTSEFGAKLDNFADSIRKPSCFLGVGIYFYINGEFLFSLLTAIILVAHVIVHKMYGFIRVFHCDLEFPDFQRKLIRHFAPRIVALYTYFEEQFIMFIVVPLIAAKYPLPKRGLIFVIGAVVAVGLCLLKMLIIYRHRRQGRYPRVFQDWANKKGYLDESPCEEPCKSKGE